jgi:thiosulfate dehydrogenase
MKKYSILIAILAGAFLFLIAFSQAEKKEAAQVDPDAALKESIENGKKLFMDASLGTSGMSCNSCHAEGGTKDNEMGNMTMKAFDNLNVQYPKYFPMAKKVMTLDQVVNLCITNALKGEALSWDDQKLADLVAYIASAKAKK